MTTQSVTKTFIPFIHDAKEPKRFTNGSIQNLLKEMNTIITFLGLCS